MSDHLRNVESSWSLLDQVTMPIIVRIHHCAFAHDSARSPEKRFAELFEMPVCHSEDVEGFIERMIPAGDGYIQTLEATGPGVVQKFLARRGSALHHVAFEVDDIDGYLQKLKIKGVQLIDDKARPGGMGTMIAFIHPSEFDGLLVELVEVPEPPARG
jgi:methylmalonyl-CoA/ethylmalonyl-CoA epimerase